MSFLAETLAESSTPVESAITTVSFVSNIDALLIILVVIIAAINHRREKSARSRLILLGFVLIGIRSLIHLPLAHEAGQTLSQMQMMLGESASWVGALGVALIGIGLLKRV